MSQIQSKHLFALGVLLTALSIAISGFASASEETNVPQLIINDGKQDQLIINDGKQDQLIEDEKATAKSLKKNVSQNAASQKQPKYPANKDKSKQDSQKRHTKKQH